MFPSSFRMLVAQALIAAPLLVSAVTPLPDYALTYAPYIYLASDEGYWPSEITTHLQNTFTSVNKTSTGGSATITALGSMSTNTFLTSKDDVFDQDQPNEAWLVSAYGKPDSNGLSTAPATIIAVQKPNNVVDVFYFAFYSWDLGTTFLNIRFGNHVGDWEHTMVRFTAGRPTGIYLSAHSAGTAYSFSAIPKAPNTQRPVTYVAKGTHANYATAGSQPYPVPVIGPIVDSTSKGAFWDVTKNHRAYWFDSNTSTFTDAGGKGKGGELQATETPAWLNFRGRWGNDLPSTDILKNEQYCVSTECHFVAGPTGPIDKNLGRRQLCQSEDKCTVSTSARMASPEIDFRAQLAELADSLVEAQERGLLKDTRRTEL